MGLQPWVVVEPPDSRGLRKVVVNGEVVGSAWSSRELRRLLVRLGYPSGMDVEDPASVRWRGGDSGTWPDRPVRRHVTSVLMVTGMLVSAVLHMAIGWPDALRALTFAQRVVGCIFVLAGLAQCVAAVAAFDHCGRRQVRVSGAVTLLGAFIALPTTATLLAMWSEEREYTPFLLVFAPLFVWSLWALVLLVRQKAWKGMPQPKKFAAGVIFTSTLTGLSLAYSTMYQPTVAPVRLALKAQFGEPRTESGTRQVAVPLSLSVKNDGGIPVYIINDDYTVWGTPFDRAAPDEGLARWKAGSTRDFVAEAERYVRPGDSDVVKSGHFYGPGSWLEVGEEFAVEKVVRLPRSADYGELEATMSLTYMRKDRGRLEEEFGDPHLSWDVTDKRFFCAPEECGYFAVYHGRVQHNNNLVNVTRRPRYVTAFWNPERKPDVFISSFDFRKKVRYVRREDVDKAEVRREAERFGVGMFTANARLVTSDFLERPAGG